MNNLLIGFLLFCFTIAYPYMAGAGQRLIISQSGDAFLSIYTEEGRKNIMKYDHLNKSLLSFYPITDQINCHLNDLSFDPNGKKLAFWGYCKLSDAILNETSPKGFYRITVLDIEKKKEIIILDHGGRSFSFSPKGDAIVYAEEIPGERGSPAPLGYQGGVWLYDFKSKTRKRIETAKINTTSVYNMDVNWSEHDGNIYITNFFQTLRYDVSRDKTELTAYQGMVYFSPDGKYYVILKAGGANSNIYRTSDNKQMLEWEASIKSNEYCKSRGMYFLFWSKILNAAIFMVDGDQNVVFDIEKQKIIGIFPGYFIGMNPDGALVVITPKGKDWRSEVEILNLLDLIQPKSGP